VGGPVVQNRTYLLLQEKGAAPNLASRALAASCRELASKWQECSGYRPLLAERFTDPEACIGTNYKASGRKVLSSRENRRIDCTAARSFIIKQSNLNLFLFPHQDDEYFVAPLLADEPARARCFFLTKGDFHGCDPAVRNKESVRALNVLGVPRENIMFLGEELEIPDNRLMFHLETVSHSLKAEIRNPSGLKKIYVPAYEGGHPDHDAASILGAALGFELDRPVFEFYAYHAHPQIPYFFEVMKPTGMRREGSFQVNGATFSFRTFWLFRFYPSQWKTWLGLLPQLCLRCLRDRRIFLHPSRREDFDSRPHPGTLYYECRGWTTFSTFAEQTKKFRKKYLGEES
jgi:hypothetical protein